MIAAAAKGSNQHFNQAWDRAEKKVNCLDHRYPIRLQKNGYLQQSIAQTRECYLNGQQRRIDTASAETHLPNETPDDRPNSMQVIARVENLHKRPACLPINECPDVDARRSSVHFERTQKSHARVHQNGHPNASDEENMSQESVSYFKPRGYQTQPMTTGNPARLTSFSGIQFNANQLELKNPMEIESLRLPHTLGKLKHHPHPMWRNPGPVRFPDPIRSYTEVSTNLTRQNREPDANSAKCKPFSVVVSNDLRSKSVMPSLHHPSAESDNDGVRRITTDLSSASTPRAVHKSISPGGIHSAIPAAYSYYPQDTLSRGENEKDPTSTKCHVCCKSGKQATAALPDHIMNVVPTDIHLACHLPARQLPIYTPEQASETRSQKAYFPVHLVSVRPEASCQNAPNGPSCSADGYRTWDVRQPVSPNASQSLKTNGKVQCTTGYAPSQINASERLSKVPLQYSCQSTSRGFCRPTEKETSAPNHRINSMNSVHQETPPCSKSNAMIVVPPRHSDYVAHAVCQPVIAHRLVTSNLRCRSINGHLHAEPNKSNNVSRSANSAFQEQRDSRDGPYSSVNSCSAPKQQPHNENSADDFKYGCPSSWSNVSRYASPNITRGYPAILTRDQRRCDSLERRKKPDDYISVDSKPQGDKKKEEFKLSEAATRCREIVQPREDRMPGIDQEQRTKKLETFTKFVVGVETRIHWDKIRNNSKNSNRSKEHDMHIVSVSSTHSPRDDPTEMHSSSSQSESDDAFCMMRLERVYYSISAKPFQYAQSSAISQEQGSEPNEFVADSHKGNPTNPYGDTRHIIANCQYGSEQSSSNASRNKLCEGSSLVMKGHKTAHVPVSRSVKRKANTNSTKSDEVCTTKRRKMEKNNSKVSPKGKITPVWEKVKKSGGNSSYERTDRSKRVAVRHFWKI